jgi:hypothetical protein
MQLTVKSTGNQNKTNTIPLHNSIPNKPDPEVPEKKSRRRFTAKYKLGILAEIDGCTEPGEVGAILRRNGLYYSNINTWRRQKQEGVLQALSPKKRGRKKRETSFQDRRIAELERENRSLSQKLKQAETIIEVQKKISEILGVHQPDSDNKKP